MCEAIVTPCVVSDELPAAEALEQRDPGQLSSPGQRRRLCRKSTAGVSQQDCHPPGMLPAERDQSAKTRKQKSEGQIDLRFFQVPALTRRESTAA